MNGDILITGASGFIGAALVSRLTEHGRRVVKLRRGPVSADASPAWNPDAGEIHLESAAPYDAVVHLAGENIAQRWTPKAKARIWASRVDATHLLSEALVRLPRRPRVMVCASATGFYGDRPGEALDEQSGPGAGFLAETCRAWEAAAEPAWRGGIRVVWLRLGIVLARHAGALAKMLPVFRLGLGGRLGGGAHYWSWIALDDLTRVVEMALQDDGVSGPVNCSAPKAITNSDFTAALARALRRPALLQVPALVVKVLFGEMGREALLASARVRPARLLERGFEFRWPEIDAALNHALASAAP